MKLKLRSTKNKKLKVETKQSIGDERTEQSTECNLIKTALDKNKGKVRVHLIAKTKKDYWLKRNDSFDGNKDTFLQKETTKNSTQLNWITMNDINEDKDTVNELSVEPMFTINTHASETRDSQKKKSLLKNKKATTRNLLSLTEPINNDNEPNTNYKSITNTDLNFNNLNSNYNDKSSSFRLTTGTPSPFRSQLGSKTTNYQRKKTLKLLADNIELLLPITKNDINLTEPAKPDKRRSILLGDIIKDQMPNDINKEDKAFFSILVKQPQKQNKASTSRRKSLALDNQIRKLKVEMPKVEKDKIPIFTSIKKLNNYLLREYNLGESQECIKKKEEIVENTQTIINQSKANNVKMINKEHDYERKMTRQFTRQLMLQKTRQIKRLTKEMKEINEIENEKIKKKVMLKSIALEQLNENEYEDITKKDETVNSNNLRHVIKLVKILKGQEDLVNVTDYGFDSFKQLKQEYGFDEFKSHRLLRRLKPLHFLKTDFRPTTLTKFNSVNGYYF